MRAAKMKGVIFIKALVIGYSKVEALRELKFATEKYFKTAISADELLAIAAQIRKAHWQKQSKNGIGYIPCNDFSFYDNVLDTALLLNVVP